MGGAICGGVISISMLKKAMKQDAWASAMAFVLPDKQYNKFIEYKKQGKEKEAKKIFDRYAISQI